MKLIFFKLPVSCSNTHKQTHTRPQTRSSHTNQQTSTHTYKLYPFSVLCKSWKYCNRASRNLFSRSCRTWSCLSSLSRCTRCIGSDYIESTPWHWFMCYRVVPAHRNHFFDPASEFLSTHSGWWSQNPGCQRCFYKSLRNCHPGSEFLHSP